MCAFSSWELSAAYSYTKGLEIKIYSEEECRELEEKAKILGKSYVLKFSPQFSEEVEWIFSPDKIREELFAAAKLEIKHFSSKIEFSYSRH